MFLGGGAPRENELTIRMGRLGKEWRQGGRKVGEEDDALCVTCFCFLSDEPSLKKWKF